MSGIAEVLLNLGYVISGSDLADSATLQRLAELGIQTYVGHAADNVDGADAVVTSTAVQADNPEVLAARERHIPVVPARADAGRADAPEAGHRDCRHPWQDHHHQPGRQRAGRGRDWIRPLSLAGGSTAPAPMRGWAAGDYIVVEADESDASFLNLLPVMAVVTNIDADHMETYGHDFSRLKSAFVDFLHRMPFYGTAILCIDDPAVREIVPQVSLPDHQLRLLGRRAGARHRRARRRRPDALHRAAPQRRHAAGSARGAESAR